MKKYMQLRKIDVLRNRKVVFRLANDYSDAPRLIKDFLYYEQIVKGHSELTVKNYYTDLRTFFRFYKFRNSSEKNLDDFSRIDISDITDDDIKSVDLLLAQEFLIFMKSRMNNGPQARYRKAVTLRQFYKYLTTHVHLFEVSPMTNLELPSPKPALPKFLTLEEALEVLSGIETADSKRDYCIVVFFMNCGMRLSELVGIDISDISRTTLADGREQYTLRVLGKGSKERMIYLNEACVNAYIDYVAPNELDPETREAAGRRLMTAKNDALFLSKRGTRISNRRVQQIIEDCFKRAGLDNKGYSVHKLRHTAATLMYQNGVDVRTLKDVLGHENLNTTQIYTHVSNKQLQEAMDQNPLANVKPRKKT